MKSFKKYIPAQIKKAIKKITFQTEDEYCYKSYSQEGEDMVLKNIFENKEKGFYVDVGAHHPKRFSNTYFFYSKGWNGINIDPRPGCMQLFNKIRPKDINLEIGIGLEEKGLAYYMFEEPAYNTFDEELAKIRIDSNVTKLINKRIVKTNTLKSILDKYTLDNTSIDFLSIDVEGFDFEVLQSNDWVKYKPKIVLVESLRTKFEDIFECQIYRYLHDLGYSYYARTGNSNIYIYNKSIQK